MLLTAVLGLAVFLFLFYHFCKFLRTYFIVKKIPSPPGDFVFGHVLRLEKEPDDLVKQIYGWDLVYGSVWALWFSYSPLVFLTAPAEVEALLSSNKHISKSREYIWTHPWLGTGLLTSDGPKWFKRRKLLTPTFHFTILEGFVKIFVEQADTLVKKLESYSDGGEFNIWPVVTYCVLDVICETSMGKSMNAQDHSDSEYVKAVVSMSELIQERQISPWLWSDLIYNMTKSGKKHNKNLKILHGVTNQVIDERMEERKRSQCQRERSEEETKVSLKKRRLAFLDLLLEAHEEGLISKEGIREEVDTFMFEGHDTTAAGINWALHLIGSHPEVQKKLQEEVDEVFVSNTITIKSELFTSVPHCSFCGDVFKYYHKGCGSLMQFQARESLRIFPSVPMIGREVKEEFEVGGYKIPRGVSVGVLIGALHRNPNLWPDPLVYKPERFLPENAVGRHPFSFVPFSAGPRNCIGQKFALFEEKVIISSIIHRFSVESVQKLEDVRPCAELIMRPKKGIWVKLTARK